MVVAPLGRRSSSLVDGEARALHSYVFQVAASKTLRAHHALGRLLGCRSAMELSIALREFFTHAESVERAIERIGRMGEDDLVFSAWFANQLAALSSHPISIGLRSAPPSVYLSRLAHGSHPSFGEAPAVRRACFFIDGLDDRPAFELCADYLDRATKLLDDTRQRLLELAIR